jgi:metal-responsive CopG/Arc/MetJ family transcriptional regulator
MPRILRSINMNLPKELIEELDRHRTKQVTRTDLVEMALTAFLKGRERPVGRRPTRWSRELDKR